MSGIRHKRRRLTSEAVAEVVDLDVTPVMNVFVILIPFLVSMAVFTHIAVINFSLPPDMNAVAAHDRQEKPKLKLTVVVTSGFLAITRGELLLDSIGLYGDTYDYVTFAQRLTSRYKSEDTNDEIVVSVKNSIVMRHVVRVMDVCREIGFQNIGLSQAPDDFSTL